MNDDVQLNSKIVKTEQSRKMSMGRGVQDMEQGRDNKFTMSPPKQWTLTITFALGPS